MNKFVELMEELSKLENEERSEKIKQLETDCVCPTCPTYNDCAKDKGENVFCIIGKRAWTKAYKFDMYMITKLLYQR